MPPLRAPNEPTPRPAVPPGARRATVAAALIALALALSAPGADIPTPEAHLGFRPGADNHLATWPQVVDFFRAVDAASDRVHLQTLGESTEGRPLIMAVISSPEGIRDLDRYRAYQRTLSHPPDPPADGEPDPAQEAIDRSRAVVLITCSIHSSETASTHMALELLHELATADDEATREILDRTILLLVPSANPDGVDRVADWYPRTLGKPWEGSGMPRLYHKYAGHDTNRDWFMLNLQETRLLTRMLYREWYPTLAYDVHEMGREGARMFVPPFYDPINPNLDPRIHQSIAVIGAHMASDLAAADKRGVLTHAMYDNWWNGGNRTTPQRHNIVGVLTESAGVRLASPLFLPRNDLKAAARGFASHQPAINFVDPWPGGWWHLRDILEYQKICARSLLTLATRYRADYQRQYLAMSREAVRKGRTEPPFAWVVPADGPDPARAARLVRILHDTGIEVHRAPEPFEAAGATFPAGSWVLPAAQPYRAHLKDMMERQVYPARFTAGGAAEPPYDVAGWTLPLQMGVPVAALNEPIEPPGEPLDAIDDPTSTGRADEQADYLVIDNRANDDLRLLRALAGDPDLRIARTPLTIGGREAPAGSILVPARAKARALLDPSHPIGRRARVRPYRGSPASDLHPFLDRLNAPRVGLYQPWVPSMDEGWTRLVLEAFDFPYTTLHDADVRAGRLRDRLDAIILPSVPARTLRDGYKADETEPAYVGGLGPDGSRALRQFIEAGGTLVCLEDACHYAIAEWGLPVKERLADLRSAEFYCPGSILRLTADPAATSGRQHPLILGMPPECSAYFDHSLAFDAENDDAQVIARYAPGDPLESGWLLGADKLAGRAALVDVSLGKGHVTLFGFPPQHRGQTHGTFRLFFNALLRAGMEAAD